MKKIFFTLLSIILLSSCNEDFLDIPREDAEQAENFFQNQDDAVQSINAIYSNLRFWRLAGFGPLILSIAGDDAEKEVHQVMLHFLMISIILIILHQHLSLTIIGLVNFME